MSRLREALRLKSRDYLTIFEANVVKVTPVLEKCTPIEFTFHGVNHCRKLEEYASLLISDELLEFLNAEEIFILLNGIYYHDLGMISYEKVVRHMFDSDGRMEEIVQLISNRNEHNVISQKMIYNQDETWYNSELISLPYNDISFANSISNLCLAHRNHKNENGKPINTLMSCEIKDHYRDVAIHTRSLACILRLADELDITNQRAPGDVLIHIKSFISQESVDEWINHEFFGKVDIDSKTHEIYLRPHIQSIVARDKFYNDRLKTRILLFSKLAKINAEIELIEDALEDDTLPKEYKLVYKAKIFLDGECVTKSDRISYKKERDKASMNDYNGLNSEQSEEPYTKSIINHDDIDYKKLFFQGVERLKENKELVSTGFFKLPSDYYCKFYINTNIVISNNRLLNRLSRSFTLELKNIQYDCIIGVDKAGSIIGANLSIITGKLFTYAMFGDHQDSKSIEFEENISSNLYGRESILLTDVIASGSTLEATINKCKEKLGSNIKAVCSIFSISHNNLEEMKKKYDFPIMVLSEDYAFELYSKEDIEGDEVLRNEFELLNKINQNENHKFFV